MSCYFVMSEMPQITQNNGWRARRTNLSLNIGNVDGSKRNSSTSLAFG